MKGANRKKAEKKKAKAAERKIREPREYKQSRMSQPPWGPKPKSSPMLVEARLEKLFQRDLEEMGAVAR